MKRNQFKKIRSLIKQNEISTALSLLEKVAGSIDSSLVNKIIMLSSQFSTVNENYTNSNEINYCRRQRIVFSALEYTSELELKSQLIGNSSRASATKMLRIIEKKSKNAYGIKSELLERNINLDSMSELDRIKLERALDLIEEKLSKLNVLNRNFKGFFFLSAFGFLGTTILSSLFIIPYIKWENETPGQRETNQEDDFFIDDDSNTMDKDDQTDSNDPPDDTADDDD